MENATQIVCRRAEDSAKITISGYYIAEYARDDFPERKGAPLFRIRIDEKKAISLLSHICEGCGVRKTERLVGVNRNTAVLMNCTV